MKILCKLPKLEVLKIKYYAFRGSEWEPTDERFQQLKFLLLDGTDLIHWKASSIQFPKLRSLVLKNCYCLYEIPDDVAEIPTLQFIELYNCSSTADDSANRILEEQLSLGNDDLVLLLYHVDLLSGVKGQVASLHRELSLMKAFLKVSQEKRTSARIIQQEKQEGHVKDNVFKLVIYPPGENDMNREKERERALLNLMSSVKGPQIK
ncbi:hypothetical protein BC332_25072 [Capsicum chinense]|nr:hypothetical protein BC332_25072 [Capsicum chinense]